MSTPENKTEAAPELRDHEIAKCDCLAFIADTLKIKATITGGGYAERREKPDDKPWAHFRWSLEAERDGKIAHLDDYKCGLGHAKFRKLPSYDPAESYSEFARRGTIHTLRDLENRKKAAKNLTPTPPDAADILGAYARDFIDAHRAGCFEEWAGELGYDTDSRSAEETYQTCLNQRRPLLALGLAHHQIEKLADYAGQF